MSRSKFGTVGQLASGRWRARIRLDGRQHSLGTYATESEAWAVVDAAQDELHRGHVVVGGADTLLLHGPRWLDARELDGVRGIRTERSRWRNHFETWDLAAAPMRTITRGDVKDWMAGIARRSSRATAQRCLSLLRGMLDDAADRKMLDGNPAIGVRLPGRIGRVDDPWDFLDWGEQQAYLQSEQVPVADRLLIGIALGTGVRQGEQFAARLEDVDLQRETWTIRRSGDGATKSGAPRTIPLFGLGLASVRAWIDGLDKYAPRNPKRLLCPLPSGARRQPGPPLGTVWRVVDGTRKRIDRWHDLQAAAGLRRVRWHDLRHTFGTSLAHGLWGSAVPPVRVQEWMGHSSITVTEKYVHPPRGVSQRLSHAIRQSVVGQPGLEPGTYGLKGRGAAVTSREVTPDRDPRVTLAQEYLGAVAGNDPRRDAIGVRLAVAILEQVGKLRETGTG